MAKEQLGPTGQPASVGDTLQEVWGRFPSDAALQEAIGQLTLAGFDRADLSLPATAPQDTAASTPEQGARNPDTADDGTQMRTLLTGLAGSAAAIAAAAVVIGTGGGGAPVVGAAVAAGLGAGAVTNAASRAADGAQHDDRESAAAQGALVLSVRAPTAEKRAVAEQALRQAGAADVQPISRRRGEPQQPLTQTR